MNKQKLAELAKQLEELVEQDGTGSTILDIQIHKVKNHEGTIRVRVNRFLRHEFRYDAFYWEDDVARDKDIKFDDVTFQYRYFKAVEKEDNHEAL